MKLAEEGALEGAHIQLIWSLTEKVRYWTGCRSSRQAFPTHLVPALLTSQTTQQTMSTTHSLAAAQTVW